MSPAPGELRDQARRGFVWLGAASVLARVLEVAKVFVVLWCLSSEELGAATLAASVCVVLEALSGLGIGQALLQAASPSARLLASAFWYTLGVATLLVLGVWLSADAVAAMYGHPELAAMMRVAITKLWFVGAAVVPIASLSRALAYERLAVTSTLATLASALTSGSLALAGAGAWAPVLGSTAGGLATLIGAVYASRYRPARAFDWRALRPHASFGAKLAASSGLNQLYRNVDYLLVGRFLGVEALGLYRVAFDLAMTPCLAVWQVVSKATVPLYARLAHDRDELSRTFLWTLGSLGLTLAPLCALIALHAGPLLTLLQDGAFQAAAGLVPVLCVAAFLRCIAQCFPALLQALCRPWWVVADSLSAALLAALCMATLLTLTGPRLGTTAAALGWLCVLPLQLGLLVAMAQSLIPLPLRALFASQRHVLGAVAVMVAARGLTLSFAIHDVRAALAVSVTLSVGAYLGYLRLFARVRPGAGLTRSAPATPTPPAARHRAAA